MDKIEDKRKAEIRRIAQRRAQAIKTDVIIQECYELDQYNGVLRTEAEYDAYRTGKCTRSCGCLCDYDIYIHEARKLARKESELLMGVYWYNRDCFNNGEAPMTDNEIKHFLRSKLYYVGKPSLS
jgi:hypothetical protein